MLDYRAEASRLGPPVTPIVDCHAHINGPGAATIYREAARLYGVDLTYSMSRADQAERIRDILGGRVRFIAVPRWEDPDRARSHREGLIENIELFRARFAAGVLKIWGSPRLRDLLGADAVDAAEIDSPWRVRACEVGERLGMMYMVHVADPDAWFATTYADAARYGTKASHYERLERMLDRFTNPWIAAHLGGWPENLPFLDGLLSRHANLNLDCSATKWMVRELGRHEPGEVRAFLERWRGRVLFGSDIVTTDEHLSPNAGESGHPMAHLADGPEAAFELYASRYWAMRTMFETAYDGESPIADPDLKRLEPDRYDDMSAPRLRGLSLPPEVLASLYRGAAERVLLAWERTHPA